MNMNMNQDKNMDQDKNGFDYLLGIVTGMEHSGTTLLSQIINSHPDVFSGFEMGVLLKKQKFEEIKPFNNWLKGGHFEWGLPNDYNIDELDTEQTYEYIYKNKGTKGGSVQELIRKSKFILDKTPQYIYNLNELYTKIPNTIPFFIILKPYTDILFSYYKRNANIANFQSRIKTVIEIMKWIDSFSSIPRNIFVFNYEICMANMDLFIEELKRIIQYKVETEGITLSLDNYIKKLDNKTKPQYFGWQKTDPCFPTELIDETLKNEYDQLLDKLCWKPKH